MSKDRMLLAVLIDADNLSAKYAEEIMNEVKTFGVPVLRRVYGDWSSPTLATWKEEAFKLGMALKQVTANTTRKNASDIGLVIDAMDILHSGRFDGFVLVSSDSDFTALASRLREDGAEVIGIGESKAPDSLINVCSRFILIGNIVAASEVHIDAKTQTQHPIKQPGKLIKLIDAAMRSIDTDDEWVRLGLLGSHLVRANPDFDTRAYGRAKLSDLVAKLNPFELRKQDGHFEVRKKENGKT